MLAFCVKGPTEDGVELTQPLIHQATQHPHKGIPVLGGANLDEGTEFMSATPVRSCSCNQVIFNFSQHNMDENFVNVFFASVYTSRCHASQLHQTLTLGVT